LLVRSDWSQAEQQTEKRKKWTHVRRQYSLKPRLFCGTEERSVLPFRLSEFFSVFMTGEKFAFLSR
jgi:hypothetical protein